MDGLENALPMPSIEASIRESWRRLLAFVRKRIGPEADAEDLVQDVFQRLAASHSVTDPIEDATAWLFAAARNAVVDTYRKRAAATPAGRGGRDAGVAPDDLPAGRAGSPERELWRSALWEELEDALDELPAAQREVFLAHELDGVSFRELAARTGEPLNTLLSRKRYAVLFLRERLRHLYDEMDGMTRGGS